MISICRSSILIWRLNSLLLILLCLPCAALAQEVPVFRPLAEHTAQERFFGADHPAQTRIAEIDLNRDGLNELILSLPDGAYRIYAAPPRGDLVPLGSIPPSKGLIVADQTDFGVRRLIVSGSATNDYLKRAYRWNPQEGRYLPVE